MILQRHSVYFPCFRLGDFPWLGNGRGFKRAISLDSALIYNWDKSLACSSHCMTEVTLPVVIVKKPFSVVLSSKFSFKALPSEVMHFMWIPSIPDIKQVRSSFQPKRKKKKLFWRKTCVFFFPVYILVLPWEFWVTMVLIGDSWLAGIRNAKEQWHGIVAMTTLVKIFEHHGQCALAILLIRFSPWPQTRDAEGTDLPSPQAIPLNQV